MNKFVVLLQHDPDISPLETKPSTDSPPSAPADPRSAGEDDSQDVQQLLEPHLTAESAALPAPITVRSETVLEPAQGVQDSSPPHSEQGATLQADQVDLAEQHVPDEELSQPASANTDQSIDSQAAVDAEDVFQQPAGASALLPDSNGINPAPVTEEPEQQHSPISARLEHSASTEPESETEDGAHEPQQLQQPAEDQQARQQLPGSSLYLSSQVDASSEKSLPDSVQSAAGSRQQPASPSGQDGAVPHGGTDAEHVNGIMHASQQAESEQQMGSQQSSEDHHEQQAVIPGISSIRQAFSVSG